MKKGWIITLIILLLAIGIFAGIYVYRKNKTQNINLTNYKQLALYGEKENLSNENQNDIVLTSAVDEKVSPNATVLEKEYFKGCDHLIKTTKEIPDELINQNREAVESFYYGWDIDNFSSNEIIVYRETDGYCDQHYLVKEHNGVLGIYTLDENGNELLKKDTEIQTQYLPEEDIEKLRKGINAIGDMELNTVLGDFE